MEAEFQDSAQARRKYPRRELHKSIGVLSRGNFFIAQSVELGEGGMSLKSEMILNDSSLVILCFQVPGEGFVSVRAKVCSTQKEETGMVIHGLSFENLTFSGKREIRAFVSARTRT